MKKLPVLISIPHGGNKTPAELLPHTNMNAEDIYLDGDAHTAEIYDFTDQVFELHMASTARCYIDLNRSEADLPPENPDGVLKTVNLYGKPVYKNDWFPDQALKETLLNKYYRSYHQSLLQPEKRGIELAIDCHSMLAYPPDFGKDKVDSQPRPEICLGNLGGIDGAAADGQVTSCSKELLEHFARGLEKAFFNEDIRVSKNDPFKGGYITRYHGTLSELPWIQLEINRNLYMDQQYLDPGSQRPKQARITDLQNKIFEAVKYVFS